MAQRFTVPITIKQLSSAGSDAITVYVDADTYARLQVQAGGRLVWGSGSGIADTNLYRDDANVLKTDDTFKAAALFVDGIEIDTSGATAGQVLKYDGSKFAPDTDSTGESGAITLGDLTDVSIASVASGEFFKYNGTAWVNDVINLGTDTTGDYTQSVSGGTGVTVTGGTGEGSTPSIAIGQAVGTSDTVTFAGATIDSVQIGITAVNEIDTASGNLVIDSAGGTVTIDDDLVVSGNLTVSGTTTTINTETLNLADNIITLNSNETGTPSQNAGIEVERGTSDNVAIRWNEGNDKWELTTDGTNYYAIGTLGNVVLGTDTSGDYVSTVSAGTGVSVTGGTGEGSTPSIAIGQAIGTSDSPTFVNVTLTGTIVFESINGGVYDLAFDHEVITANRTITFPDEDGTVAIYGNIELGTDTTGNYVSGVSGGTGISVAHTPGEGSTPVVSLNASLADINNVSSATPSSGQYLEWTGSEWAPGSIHLGTDTDGNYLVDISAGTGISVSHTQSEGSTATVSLNASLNDLSNVTAPTPSSGHFLKWNGSAWVNDAIDLDTDTSGSYVESITGGTGVSITGGDGHGSTPSVAIGQSVATSADVTFNSVTSNLKGDVKSTDGTTVLDSGTDGTDATFTGAVTGNASTASTLETSRTIELTGDVTGSVSFDGSANVQISTTIGADSVALGTDTTGNYVDSVTGGTGVTVTGGTGEGSTPSIAIGQAIGTADSPTFAGATIDAVQVGITASNEIDTSSGNLVIDSAGGTVTVDDNLVVSGDLTVNGTTTTVNTETINLADNIITLNSNETGTPTQDAGLEIERGTSTNVSIRWNETTDTWELTSDGSNYYEIGSLGNIAIGTDTTGDYVESVTSGTGVTVTGGTGEGSTPSIAIGQDVGTSSDVTFNSVTADLKGDVKASDGTTVLDSGTDGTNATFTGAVIGNASTASTLATGRTIELTGDVTGSVSFDGSANVQISTTIGADSVALGTDTVGNYVDSISAGTGVTVTGGTGEGSTPSIAIGQAIGASDAPTFAGLTIDGGSIVFEGATANDFETTFQVTDPTADRTLTFPDASGTVALSGSIALGTDTTGNYMTDVSAGTGISVSHTPGEGSTATVSLDATLDEVSDVTITSATSGDFLKWNGSAWVNDPIDLGTDTSGNYVVEISAGTGISVAHVQAEGSTATVSLNAALNDISNVSAASPSSGEFLQWNGSNWVNAVIDLGTDTAGSYVESITGGTGITVTGGTGESSTPSVSIGQDVATTANVTFASVTSNLIGDIKATDGTTVLDSGTDGTDATFTGDVTGDLTGNASTASALATARTIELTGDVTGSVSFDGSANVQIAATIGTDSVSLGTDTTGDYVAGISGGTGVTVTGGTGEGSSPSVAIGQAVGTGDSVTFANVTVSNAPTQANHAVTKTYVDAAIAGIDWHQAVKLATSTALPNSPAYNNGTSGVGATLTASTYGRLLVDGANATTGDRVLVKNQASSAHNGIYDVTQQGNSVDTYWVLTRASDMDSSPSNEIKTGEAVYVTAGSTNVRQGFVLTTSGSGTDGAHILNTDDLSFTQFTGTSAFTAGAGMAQTGNTLNVGTASATRIVVNADDIDLASVAQSNTSGSATTTFVSGVTVDSYGRVTGQETSTVSFNNTALTGTPTAPTASVGDSTTQVATTAFVDSEIASQAILQSIVDAKGDLIVASGADTVARLPLGTNGYFLKANSSATNGVEWASIPTINNLDDIGDVNAPTPSDGQFLKYVSGSSEWQAADAPTFTVNNLDDVGDVTITSASSGQFLKWNGTAWVNDSIDLGTDTTGNYVVDISSGTGVLISHTLGEGSTPTVSIGQDVGTTADVTFNTVSADLTGNVTGNASTASALQTARTIELTGEVTGSVSFDGSGNVQISTTIGADTVALGTDTTGNYVADVSGGTGVTVTHTPGEGSTPTVAIGQAVGTSDSPTFAGATLDAIQVGVTASNEIDTSSGNLTIDSAGGTVTVDDNLIVSGDLTVSGTTTTVNTETINLADNIITLNSNETGTPSQNAGIEIERGTSTNVELRWNETTDSWELTEDGTTFKNIAVGQDVETTSNVTFNTVTADLTGDVTGNADTATALQTSRTIELTGDVTGSASFDGTANATLNVTISSDSVALGTDTTGDYVQNLVAGTGVTLSANSGESATPSIAIGQDVGTTADVTFNTVTADLTGDVTGNADTATALQTARTISLGGDISGSASFDGTANVTITATVQPDSVALGTDTTGNYMSGVTAGTGISVTHTPGEGSNATIALNASVDDLTDLNIATPAEYQTLVYDGSEWINEYPTVVSFANNAETTSLSVGEVVYISGGSGNRVAVKRADNGSDATSSKTLGIVAASINSGANGPVVTRGYVTGIDLSTGYAAGDILWLDSSGGFTTTKPSSPDHLVFVGVVTVASNNGVIYVACQNGYELEEIHDVSITSLASGDFLKYNGSLWVNDQINLGTDTVGDYVQGLVAGTGVTLTNNSGEGATPTVAIGQDVGTGASVTFAEVETTGDLTVGGDLFVSGTLTTVNETSLAIDDPIIYLNDGSTITNPDLGIVGNYNDGTYSHSGVFRDATDGKWKFFDSYTPEPSSPIDTSHASYSPAPVVAETFESTVSTGTAPFTVTSTTEVTNLHADTASSLHTARNISLAGDLAGSASFDGSADVTITATVQANSVALGTDTTGNYMVDLAEGTGITITHTPGEGSTGTIAIGQDVGTTADVTFNSVSANITGNLTGDVTGNADTATTLETARTISLGGDLTGSASFNGSADVTITATIAADSVALGTDTTGDYVQSLVAGTGITLTNNTGEGATPTVAVTANTYEAFGAVASHESDTTNVHGITDTAALVTLAGTQTLTNKTLTSPVITGVSPQITLAGDLTGSVTLTDLGNGTLTASIAANSVALGTDTTGNYMADVSAGTGISVSHTQGEGSTATVSLNANLNDVSDVTITSVASGDFLKWNGTAWVNDVIDLGTDTTGNYVSDVTAGTGVTVTHTPGEGSSPTVAIGQAVGTSDSPTFAGATLDAIQVGVTGSNEIDTSSGNLTIDSAGGTVTVDDNLIVAGDLTVNGTTVTINSTVTTLDDPIVTLGGDTAPSTNDSKDRGVEFRWHDGSNAKVGFFGYDESSGRFTFIPDATNTSEVFSGTLGNIDVNDIYINGTGSTGSGGVVRASGAALSGTPTAPTASVGTNTTQIATTAFVNSEISSQAILEADITAKGDLVVGASSGTSAILTAGTNGYVLKANSAATYGVEWAEAGSSVTISDSAPSSPSAGDLWWESDTGKLKIYYNDGDSSQWVDANPYGRAQSTNMGEDVSTVLAMQSFT